MKFGNPAEVRSTRGPGTRETSRDSIASFRDGQAPKYKAQAPVNGPFVLHKGCYSGQMNPLITYPNPGMLSNRAEFP